MVLGNRDNYPSALSHRHLSRSHTPGNASKRGRTAPDPALFMPSMIIYVISWGGLFAMVVPLQADYFRQSSFVSIQGFLTMVQMAGPASGPIHTRWVADATGSYNMAFAGFLVASLVAWLPSSWPARRDGEVSVTSSRDMAIDQLCIQRNLDGPLGVTPYVLPRRP